MSNRHAHKQLRRQIRARMLATGERYQTARAGILAERETPEKLLAEFVPIHGIAGPATIAVLGVPGTSTTMAFLCGAGFSRGPVSIPFGRMGRWRP